MNYPMAVSVTAALVSSRLDYVNSVLVGCPQKHIARLQRAQHALAKVDTQQSTFLRATAECFARLSHRRGTRPSVSPSQCGFV